MFNKILRQFFPKGTNFDLISDDEIRRVQNVINNRPMKVFNWHSPSEFFSMVRSGSDFNVPCLFKIFEFYFSL